MVLVVQMLHLTLLKQQIQFSYLQNMKLLAVERVQIVQSRIIRLDMITILPPMIQSDIGIPLQTQKYVGGCVHLIGGGYL